MYDEQSNLRNCRVDKSELYIQHSIMTLFGTCPMVVGTSIP